MKKKSFATLLTLILTLSPLLPMFGSIGLSSPSTTIYVDPPTMTEPLYGNFTININIENITDLYAWDIKLTWDPELLDAIDITEGDFLKTGGPTLFGWEPDPIVQPEGWVFVNCRPGSPTPPYIGVNGSGTLTNITFSGVNLGNSSLSLSNITLIGSPDSVPASPEYWGDADGNLLVDNYDTVTVAKSFRCSEGDPDWNGDADFNDDNIVDYFDIFCITFNFGRDYNITDQALKPKLITHEVNDGYVTIHGPVHNLDTGLDYETIQGAIDAPETLNRHTIFVEDGIYLDPVLVDKSLSLIGEDRSTTFIEAHYVGTIVNVTARNVKITGFTIRHIGPIQPIDNGIFLRKGSTGNNISYNIIEVNGAGIYLETSSDNIISGNNITNNANGIIIGDSSNDNTITGNNIINNFYGIGMYFNNSHNTISGNNIEDNEYGISLSYTSNSTIYHNNFINNTYQVDSKDSINTWDYGYPSGGNYWDTYDGVDEKSGPDQDIAGSDGIGDTPYIIDGNNRDRYPLMYLWSSLPVHNINTGLGYPTIQEAIDAPETLNRHTIFVEDGIYYDPVLVDKSLSLIGEDRSTTFIEAHYVGTIIELTVSNVKITGFTIQHAASPEPIDFGIYVNPSSTNNNISYNNIMSNGHGIYLDTTSDNTISGNSIQNSLYGIFSYQSSDNTVYKNEIEDNSKAISIDLSVYNNISENIIKANYGGGLEILDSSNYNTIFGNNIEMNEYGIQLIDSSDNTIHHNNFIDNNLQVNNENSINTWDDGYPSGGNYWENHNPRDWKSGPNQDVEGRDTIGDTPYVIDDNNQDSYPLIYPYGLVPSPDINGDGFVDIYDIGILVIAFGSEPGDSDWNPRADVKRDIGPPFGTEIDIFDVVTVAKYWGAPYPPPTP